ncbi:MAG: DNA primase, partial [Clostridiaceae bacterium]
QQAIYDMLEGNIEKNVKNQKEMNIYGNIGQKLFIEPAYLKAERNILKLMIDDDIAFKYIVAKNIDELFVLPSHKKIYRLIIKNVKKDNFLFVIESQCTDVESSREWVSILNNKVIYDNMQEKLIDDYIQKIEKYKLEESKRKIMKQLNQSLMENNMDKASNLSKELEMIREKITSMNEKEVKNGK